MNQKEKSAAARIESEWSRVQECLRMEASAGEGKFSCIPITGLGLESVSFQSCVAELKRYGVVFARRGSLAVYVSDEPEKLVWHLRSDFETDHPGWRINDSENALSGQELANQILARLEDYDKAYQELISF